MFCLCMIARTCSLCGLQAGSVGAWSGCVISVLNCSPASFYMNSEVKFEGLSHHISLLNDGGVRCNAANHSLGVVCIVGAEGCVVDVSPQGIFHRRGL